MKNKEPFENYSPITRFLFKLMTPVMAVVMDSPLRRRFNDPVNTLKGAGVRSGQEVLEVGCGTGFFTIPAAKLVGDNGCVHAIDVHPLAIERITKKVQDAHLTNVKLTNANAMVSGLPSNNFDLVLLFGVIPAPVLPLDKLLPEMHRLLKPDGALAVWTAIPWWSPTSVTRSKLFTYIEKVDGVHNFRKVQNK